MKIVCESCGAKYSIADDRVVGKMFKIRCKRCSEVIVVRGDQQAGAAAASPASAQTGGDPSWHVVVEGEQAGPFTPQQLQEMLARGAIDWDAYVWTEGFENWLAMREVDALVSQIGGSKPRANQPDADPGAPFRARAGGDTLVGQPSMGADPFADEAGPPAAETFGGAARTPAPDLFARGSQSLQPAPAYRDGDQGVMVAAAPNPRVTAERAMTGARNENSVLFSLKNLQALATGSGSGSPPPAAPAAGDRGGYASGEGSGLIDIRALATATGVNETGGNPAQRDDLLAMGAQGGAFGALGSPILSPAADEGDGNKKTIVWGAVASVALLSLSAVVIVYMIRSPSDAPGRMIVEPPPEQHAAKEPAAAPGNAAAASPTERPGTVAAAPPTEGSEKPAAAEPEQREAARAAEHNRKRPEPAARETASKPAAPEGKTLPAAVAAPAKSRGKEGPQTIDELLDGALSTPGGTKPGQNAEAAAASTANLADTPTRDQVLSAMTGVKPAVQECAKGSGAIATVTVNVAGATGHVTNAQVAGVTGPEGSCIAQAVRKASFPRFAQKVFKVTFPYKL